jgi:sigma-E factor negative regulatory protein RseA
MKEKISALIDGELPAEEAGTQFVLLKTEVELRHAWDTYHLIGDALRGQHGSELCGRVVALLREEPTVLAPRRMPASLRRTAWYAMSAAASAAAVALVVWTALPTLRTNPSGVAMAPDAPAVAESGREVSVVPASATTAAPAGPVLTAEEAENYLLAHQPYSHSSAMQGVAPYVRTVSDERGPEKN